MPSLLEEMFGKGKKDLTKEEYRQYNNEVCRRYRRKRGIQPRHDENKLNAVEQLFGKGKKLKDLTYEQERQYYNTRLNHHRRQKKETPPPAAAAAPPPPPPPPPVKVVWRLPQPALNHNPNPFIAPDSYELMCP